MPKNRVVVESLRENLRLRWSYQGKRECLSLGLYDSPVARTVAEGKAKIIEADLATGNYDPTLKKYKAESVQTSGLSIVDLFDRFAEVKKKRVSKSTIEKYDALRKKLSDHFKGRSVAISEEDAEGFRSWLEESLKPVTVKEYLNLTKSVWSWGIKQKILTDSPWEDVAKVKVAPTQKPRPYNSDEVRAILEGFRNSRHYSHYFDFVMFLFGTGCRTGEAIGLTWRHLSPDCRTVWIGEAINQGVRGSTKTNTDREFDLSDELVAMLQARRPKDAKPDDLVFPGPKRGKKENPIDARGFRKRAWAKVLEQAGVRHLTPYKTRHAYISINFLAGENPATMSEITGHTKETMLKYYTSAVDRPKTRTIW